MPINSQQNGNRGNHGNHGNINEPWHIHTMCVSDTVTNQFYVASLFLGFWCKLYRVAVYGEYSCQWRMGMSMEHSAFTISMVYTTSAKSFVNLELKCKNFELELEFGCFPFVDRLLIHSKAKNVPTSKDAHNI